MVEVTGEGAKFWPRWRGPSGQGFVAPGSYTNRWSPKEKIKWRAEVPGTGNSSPIVWGDRIYLTTAQNNGAKLSLLAFNRADGRRVWEAVVPQEGVESRPSEERPRLGDAGHRRPDDLRIVRPPRPGRLRHGGKIVWHRRFGAIDNYHGPAGSPVLYKDRVFLYQDHSGSAAQRAFVAAFDAQTGKTLWETPRIGNRRLGNAGRHHHRHTRRAGRQQSAPRRRLRSGDREGAVDGPRHDLRGDPDSCRRRGSACSPRQGAPARRFAIRPGGSGDVTRTHVAWSTQRGSPFVPSGLLHDGLLYLINDMQSILTVQEAKTGTLVYQGRLGVAQREGFSASPVVVNGELFFTNDDGETFVVKAGREFKLLHTASLGERTLRVAGARGWRMVLAYGQQPDSRAVRGSAVP